MVPQRGLLRHAATTDPRAEVGKDTACFLSLLQGFRASFRAGWGCPLTSHRLGVRFTSTQCSRINQQIHCSNRWQKENLFTFSCLLLQNPPLVTSLQNRSLMATTATEQSRAQHRTPRAGVFVRHRFLPDLDSTLQGQQGQRARQPGTRRRQ